MKGCSIVCDLCRLYFSDGYMKEENIFKKAGSVPQREAGTQVDFTPVKVLVNIVLPLSARCVK